ncbi:MAG: MucB/RseB C-terminal domain-containing protein [Thalassolituus sp.]|jgi:sigma-E factor negative regulatory protein RseB
MKWALSLCLLLSVGLIFTPNTLHALPEESGKAELWLTKMSTAFSELNFRGLVVYGDGDHWESLEYRQTQHKGTHLSRTQYLSGIPRTQVRSGNELFCIHSGDHIAGLTPDVFKPLNRDLASKLTTILASYEVGVFSNIERIAANDAVFITLTPKSDDRYAYQLWLERTTGLPLKADLLDIKGDVLQRFQFAELELNVTTPISMFSSSESGHALRLKPTPDRVSSSEASWWPAWLPSGFALQGYNKVSGSEGRQGERLTFSDGLSSFTVFVDHVENDLGPDLTRRWHATSATVRHTRSNTGDFRISVVGELPSVTVSKIAESVTLVDQLASR